LLQRNNIMLRRISRQMKLPQQCYKTSNNRGFLGEIQRSPLSSDKNDAPSYHPQSACPFRESLGEVAHCNTADMRA